MLQELDRRHAMATPGGQVLPRQVRAVSKTHRSHEWFWRLFALLLIVAVGWVLWVSYQLQPRPLVTDQAFKAAERAETRALFTPEPVPAAPRVPPLLQVEGVVVKATEGPVDKPVALQPESTPAAAPDGGMKPSPPDTTKQAAAVPEALRLALSIETPIPDRPRPTPAKASPKAEQAEPAPTRAPAQPSRGPPAASRAEPPTAHTPAAPEAQPSRVEKRERVRTPAERAETDFRRGVALLNQGRASEADDAFNAALANNAAYRPARQALIALLLEQRRLDDARKLLQEGLAIDPSYTAYAVVLARLFVERGELAASLEVLNAAKGSARGNAEYNALLGTVLQRLAKHREAADAYREALRLAPDAGPAWVGLAMSLEALEHRPEAAEAFRRAMATGSLSTDLRVFAEQRAHSLQR